MTVKHLPSDTVNGQKGTVVLLMNETKRFTSHLVREVKRLEDRQRSHLQNIDILMGSFLLELEVPISIDHEGFLTGSRMEIMYYGTVASLNLNQLKHQRQILYQRVRQYSHRHHQHS